MASEVTATLRINTALVEHIAALSALLCQAERMAGEIDRALTKDLGGWYVGAPPDSELAAARDRLAQLILLLGPRAGAMGADTTPRSD